MTAAHRGHDGPPEPALVAGSRVLNLAKPAVMGVLNLTPDSFSDGGELYRDGAVDSAAVLARGQAMVEAGAAVLDLGGESSRPGAQPVSAAEELDRVLPALAALQGLPVMLSVDTRNAPVAAAAIAAGAHLINDINGGREQAMLEAVAATNAGYCIMHMRGTPQTMQRAPQYDDVIAEVGLFLNQQLEACAKLGIDRQRLLIDPGIGFGKSLDHNLELLRALDDLVVIGVPILVGVSRKSMLGAITGQPVEQRLSASIAAAVIAVQHGASIVRSHDVRATVDALAVWTAICASR